ncbi:MAG: MarR family transcriptional regulator [Myxococcota bacterium]
MGQLLFRAARLFNERAVARVREEGQPALRVAHTRLLPHIDLGGTRLTELARRAGVTKQAVGPLVAELEAFGVLRREPDPADGRARRVCFTEGGRRALLHGLAVLGTLEGDLREQLGSARLAQLRGDLETLVDALEGTDRDPTTVRLG